MCIVSPIQQIHWLHLQSLLDNLKLPEYRARYRTRRELRGRPQDSVLTALPAWIDALDSSDPRYAHHLVEALWVTWGLNQVDEALLRRVLQSDDYRARAAAVRVLRYSSHQIPDQEALLVEAASDLNGRVRLEAIVAASWLQPEAGIEVLRASAKMPLDRWMAHAHLTALTHLQGHPVGPRTSTEEDTSDLAGTEVYQMGKSLYNEDGYCGTCHRPNGKGLPATGIPPLAGSEWVAGDAERLIKITLHGLQGPLTVGGTTYPGQVPMTPFKGLLTDEEIAAVLTYVRNAFGNTASPVTPDAVAAVRAATANQQELYTADDLLQE